MRFRNSAARTVQSELTTTGRAAWVVYPHRADKLQSLGYVAKGQEQTKRAFITTAPATRTFFGLSVETDEAVIVVAITLVTGRFSNKLIAGSVSKYPVLSISCVAEIK